MSSIFQYAEYDKIENLKVGRLYTIKLFQNNKACNTKLCFVFAQKQRIRMDFREAQTIPRDEEIVYSSF